MIAQLRDEILVNARSFYAIEQTLKRALELISNKAIEDLLVDAMENAAAARSTSSDILEKTENAKLPFDPSLAVVFGTSNDLNLVLAQVRGALAILGESPAGSHKSDCLALLATAATSTEYLREVMDEVETALRDAMEAEANHE